MIADNAQMTVFQRILASPGWLWQRMVEPPASITDVSERRQARLLLSLNTAVMTIIVLMWTAGYTLLPDYAPPPAGLVGVAVFVITPVIIHRGHYQLGATFYLLTLTALPFLILAGTNRGIENIYFVLLTPVQSSMFVNSRRMLLLSGTSLAGILLLPLVNPVSFPEFTLVLFPFFIVLIITALMFFGMQNRNLIEQDRQAELRRLNEELEDRVEERTAELVVAVENAERANRVKDRFLASMSHELRTPLNAIINFAQIMVMGVLGKLSDRQESTLNEVINSAKHLLSLINDILDISKIQAGMLSLFIEDDVDVNAIMENVTTVARTLIDEDGSVKIVEDVDKDLPRIVGDRRRVQQVLLNLVANAAKFTEKGTVTISAKARKEDIMFTVQDTGPGIEKDDLERIFTPFVQTDTGTRADEGTGLGLSITKSLVETHEGKLWVESTPGEGSAFFFTIPIQSETLRKQIA